MRLTKLSVCFRFDWIMDRKKENCFKEMFGMLGIFSAYIFVSRFFCEHLYQQVSKSLNSIYREKQTTAISMWIPTMDTDYTIFRLIQNYNYLAHYHVDLIRIRLILYKYHTCNHIW